MSILPQERESDHPRHWDWTLDGLECAGTFVRLDEASSAFGPKGIVVLEVDSVERSVWLNQTALASKFADELERRRAEDFNPGEQILIRRAAEKRESAGGRSYWPFSVEFSDAPKRTARAILGLDDAPDDEPKVDDDIPF